MNSLLLRNNSRMMREVSLPYQGKTYSYPKSFFLVHAMGHSAEHRTEVKIALAHIGIETPDLDGWYYSQSAGYGQEITTGDAWVAKSSCGCTAADPASLCTSLTPRAAVLYFPHPDDATRGQVTPLEVALQLH